MLTVPSMHHAATHRSGCVQRQLWSKMTLQPLDDPNGPRLSPMSLGTFRYLCVRAGHFPDQHGPLTRTPDGSQVSEKPPLSAAYSSPEGCRRDRPANCHVISLRLIRFSPKAYRPKARQGAKPIAPARHVLFVMPRGASAVIVGGPVLSPSATLSGGGLRLSAW